MSYDAMISMMTAGAHFVVAYLATQFNSENRFLQLFFLILSVAFIPLEFGITLAVLEAQEVPSAVISAVGAGYWMSIFIAITFVALLVLKILYKVITNPVKDVNNPKLGLEVGEFR